MIKRTMFSGTWLQKTDFLFSTSRFLLIILSINLYYYAKKYELLPELATNVLLHDFDNSQYFVRDKSSNEGENLF